MPIVNFAQHTSYLSIRYCMPAKPGEIYCCPKNGEWSVGSFHECRLHIFFEMNINCCPIRVTRQELELQEDLFGGKHKQAPSNKFLPESAATSQLAKWECCLSACHQMCNENFCRDIIWSLILVLYIGQREPFSVIQIRIYMAELGCVTINLNNVDNISVWAVWKIESKFDPFWKAPSY